MDERSRTEKPLRKPGIFAGALIGVMLTAVLIALLYAAWQVAGLPFVPFDVFDWMTRVLPGRLIAFGIGSMVAVIRSLNLGPTSVVAKAVEQSVGIAGLLVTGIVAGAILFAVLRALRGRYAYVLGLVLGAVVGVPALLISYYAGQTASVAPMAGILWNLLAFLAWGEAFVLVYQRLRAARAAVVPGEPLTAAQASVERVNRRRFLIRLGGATATITVAGAAVGVLARDLRLRQMMGPYMERWSMTHPLPNAEATVKPAPGTRPEYTPLDRHYRIDINTIPPAIDEGEWTLKVTGLVEKPRTLTLMELRLYEPMHQFITLACISNPVGGDLIGTIRWTGVSLQRLLPDWRLKLEATHLKIRSVDGFFEVVPLEIIRSDERVMLTYAWDGVPLPAGHGFPLRIYIPDRYGMKQPKWIEWIEATDRWEPGYWVVRGWDKTAQMKATAVIDTVAVNMTIIDANRKVLVPIGGIAHAGARGISKVELQVDNGPWQEATLRTPLSGLTWVVWRYDWPFQSGDHTFIVRCYDGAGAPQITTPSPPDPSGATGLHNRRQML
jgi:DMSO/TMAO reductase YedYZ molybdopterin-dependent catalytic subunit